MYNSNLFQCFVPIKKKNKVLTYKANCSVSLTKLIVYTISTVKVLDYYKGKGNN